MKNTTHAIEYLQANLALPEPRPEMEPAALVAEREKAVAEARAKLAGYPQPVCRCPFERFVEGRPDRGRYPRRPQLLD